MWLGFILKVNGVNGMIEFIVNTVAGIGAVLIVLFGAFVMLWPVWVALAAFSFLMG